MEWPHSIAGGEIKCISKDKCTYSSYTQLHKTQIWDPSVSPSCNHNAIISTEKAFSSRQVLFQELAVVNAQQEPTLRLWQSFELFIIMSCSISIILRLALAYSGFDNDHSIFYKAFVLWSSLEAIVSISLILTHRITRTESLSSGWSDWHAQGSLFVFYWWGFHPTPHSTRLTVIYLSHYYHYFTVSAKRVFGLMFSRVWFRTNVNRK